MSTAIAGEPYAKRTAPVLGDASAVRAFGGPTGWLSLELGNIQRATQQARSRTVTTATTASKLDGLILCDATVAPFTVTLPSLSGTAGQALNNMVVTIKRVNGGGNAVTIGGTVDATVNPSLAAQWSCKTVQASDGAWYLLASV